MVKQPALHQHMYMLVSHAPPADAACKIGWCVNEDGGAVARRLQRNNRGQATTTTTRWAVCLHVAVPDYLDAASLLAHWRAGAKSAVDRLLLARRMIAHFSLRIVACDAALQTLLLERHGGGGVGAAQAIAADGAEPGSVGKKRKICTMNGVNFSKKTLQKRVQTSATATAAAAAAVTPVSQVGSAVARKGRQRHQHRPEDLLASAMQTPAEAAVGGGDGSEAAVIL